MLRSIPPITAFKREEQPRKPAPPRRRGGGLGSGTTAARPREWRYITKPIFARVRQPLVDVFKQAKEVQIIIDLGGFTKGEVSFGLTGEGEYHITGKHGEQEFEEKIDLPEGVDIERVAENFNNGILELILPKKGKAERSPKRRKGKS